MRDPHAAIGLVRQGTAPASWRVLAKKRNPVGAFFRGTSRDPDPVLIFTGDAAIEYVSEKKPPLAVFFADLAGVSLHAQATTTSDSMIAHLRIWLNLRFTGGQKARWQTASFGNDLRAIQQFLESWGAYQAHAPRP